MKELVATIKPAAIALLSFTVLCGFVYPLAMVAIGRAIPHPAPSELVGQRFDDPAYFWGRPSAVEYNAMTSSGTNVGPSSAALREATAARARALRDSDPSNRAAVPLDLVTASASGLDPDISPAAAYYQAPRIARLRNISIDKVNALIEGSIEERTFGILGERRVNVVRLNRSLDAIARPHR